MAGETLPSIGNNIARYVASPADWSDRDAGAVLVDIKGRQIVKVFGDPASGGSNSGVDELTASSGNVANASAAATLAAAAGETTYITGFEITASGATAAAVVTVTVTGTIGGTLSYTFVAPAGATAQATPLVVEFPRPIPASAANTAIVVTLPALGAGNTNATVVAHGFRV